MNIPMGTVVIGDVAFSKPLNMKSKASSTFLGLCRHFCRSIDSEQPYSAKSALTMLREGLEDGGSPFSITVSADEFGVMNTFSQSAQKAAQAANVTCHVSQPDASNTAVAVVGVDKTYAVTHG